MRRAHLAKPVMYVGGVSFPAGAPAVVAHVDDIPRLGDLTDRDRGYLRKRMRSRDAAPLIVFVLGDRTRWTDDPTLLVLE